MAYFQIVLLYMSQQVIFSDTGKEKEKGRVMQNNDEKEYLKYYLEGLSDYY